MAKEKGAKSTYGVPLERSDCLKLDKHRHHCEPDDFRKWVQSGYGKDKRLAVDLFSGAGGLSLGLQRAGWTTAAAVDFDERARETHAANFPGMSLCVDLGDDDQRGEFVQRILDSGAEIDLVAGGPPVSRSVGLDAARSGTWSSTTIVTRTISERNSGGPMSTWWSGCFHAPSSWRTSLTWGSAMISA